jgi:Preprotein translocase subunit SecA (ATPase, RNA helicase)
MPIVMNVHQNQGHQFKNIAIPYTDGVRGIQVVANMEKAIQSGGKSIVTEIEKSITLNLIDTAWKEHLRNMDDLKDSVQAASFEQKDPLVQYKIKAYELFKQLMSNINRSVTSFLSKGTIPIAEPSEVQEATEQTSHQPRYVTDARDKDELLVEEVKSPLTQKPIMSPHVQRQPPMPRMRNIKIGRNHSCPCGSGRKYKNCHGKGL